MTNEHAASTRRQVGPRFGSPIPAVSRAIVSAPHSPRFDVLGLGCAAVDDLLYVARFPLADRKEPVLRRSRRCGGLTGSALVAAARLGCSCAYAGRLGPDDASRCVEENFRREGIDVSHAPREPNARVVQSTIVVGEDCGSRNIFFEESENVGAHPALPAEEVIRAARVLFIDHLGMAGNLRAVRIARAAGIPVVCDFERDQAPEFPEVVVAVDHLVLSAEFALGLTGTTDAATAASALYSAGPRATVVITVGDQGCWSASPESDGRPVHHPPFRVAAIDTTGCGDVFHGAYAASLARGEPLATRIRYASAAAALKAAGAEIPRRDAVDRFLLA